jgi:uncharacterized membrane protein YphA (DoxX/SURF4 family)
MEILFFIIWLTAGGLLNFIIKAKFKLAHNLAWVYISVTALISICSWLLYCIDIKPVAVTHFLSIQINWFQLSGRVLLGYLLVNIFLSLISSEADDTVVKKIIALTLWGISILAGFSFIVESFWKEENFCRMCHFFNTSGYPVWFLYVIMIAEALGGLGVLMHFKLKTGPVAAAGLMLILIGAMYTHNHNNDPISASYAAIGEFITLALLQVIYYFEQLANPRPMSLSLTN